MAILKALPGSAKINGKPVKGKLSQIKISVINIEKFLLERKEQTKKQNENFVKQNQNFKRLQKEEKLEKPKNQWKKLVPKKIPGLSFFDSIKKFVSGWILGFIAIKLIPLLPKLIPIVVNLGKFVNFVIDIGGKFLSGFISFIDFGVKAGEATFGFLKNIGGEDFAKSFARFGGLLATVLDLMLLVGGMTLMERLTGNDGGGGLFDLFGRGKRKPPANNIRPFSRVKPPTGGRFGRSALTNLGRKGIVRVLGRQGSKQFLKLTKSFISPIVKRIPLVGALADFALNVFVFGESPGKSAFKAIGAGLGAWLLGAVGSIFPGVGTIIGAIAGGIAGDMLGGVIYDMIFDEKDPKKRDEEKKKKKKDISGSIVTGGTSGVLQAARKSSVRKGASKLAKTTGKTLSQRATKIATNVGKKRIESKAVKAIKSAPKIAKKVAQKIPKAFTKPATKALTTAGKTGVKALTTAGKTGVKALTTAGKTGVKALTTAGKTGVKAISGTLKAAKRIISPIVKKIPFIGPIVDFLLNAFVFKEPLGKSAFMAIGAGLGGSIGAMLGTLIPVPGVGTAIGAFVGGAGGDILGGMIYDAIFGGKAAEGKQKNKEKKVIKTKSESKVTGRFDMKTGKAYINDQEVALDEYEKFANMSMQEKIDQYGSGRSPSQSITPPPQPKLGKQTPRFNDQLLSVSASYETDGGQKEYTIYAPTTQINMLPGDNSNQLVTSGATVSSGDDPYEILEKGN